MAFASYCFCHIERAVCALAVTEAGSRVLAIWSPSWLAAAVFASSADLCPIEAVFTAFAVSVRSGPRLAIYEVLFTLRR